MKTFQFLAALALPAFALSACQQETRQASGGKAGGEILEASVSDAMLPLDTVRSQPPLAVATDADGKADVGSPDKGVKSAGDGKPVEPAEPQPAATPAPAASAEVRSSAE